MTATDTPTAATYAGLRDELRTWLEENWDPDLTVGDWWDRLGLAGWVAPSWPGEWFGRDLSRDEANVVGDEIAAFGALGVPGGLGLLLAGPTIVTHGSDEQKQRYLRDIVTGRQGWCQLFSEPQAGSDLAGLQTRAVQDGDEWSVTGQKVWTSAGHVADLGMLIARTNPDVPKHQGITYFALDMHQSGVDVRPLKELTGRALFNEVFLDDARTTSDAVIGGLHNGWAVANTTLAFERAGLGAGGGHAAASAAVPGTVMGHLQARAGDFVTAPSGTKKRKSSGGSGATLGAATQGLVSLAQGNGRIDDPSIRQDLMRLHSMNEIARYTNLRAKAAKEAGKQAPAPNLAKLSMSRIVRLSRDVGLEILGAEGMLHAYDNSDRDTLTTAGISPFNAMITEMALFAQAPPIYGGTDEIQKNIIGERVLGLPKEPSNDRTTAFKELLKNA